MHESVVPITVERNVRNNKWVSEPETQITFRTLCSMFSEILTVINRQLFQLLKF